jgi:hypothetical protein
MTAFRMRGLLGEGLKVAVRAQIASPGYLCGHARSYAQPQDSVYPESPHATDAVLAYSLARGLPPTIGEN